MKPQAVRVADVLLIGPAMIVGGYQLQRRGSTLGTFLLLTGVATVVYNGSNYIRAQRAAEGR